MWSGREHEYPDTTDELFTVVRCDSCGLGRLDPCPDVSELATIYPPTYYSYGMVREHRSGRPSLGDRIGARYHAKVLSHALERAGLSDRSRVRLLDVGCGDGRILGYYRAGAGRTAVETWGIDINADALAAAADAGHQVVEGRFEVDTTLEAGTFDVVVARHVIEHVEDPTAFAARARDLLTPGGVLLLATPDVSGPDARRYRGHWGGNHFPRHWWFFDSASMGRLAGQLGLEVLAVEHELNPVFWTWTAHSSLRARFPKARWVDGVFPPVKVFYPGLRSMALQVGFSAVDTVVRRRTGATGSMIVTLRRPAG